MAWARPGFVAGCEGGVRGRRSGFRRFVDPWGVRGFVDGFVDSWVRELVGAFVGSWIGSRAFGFVW